MILLQHFIENKKKFVTYIELQNKKYSHCQCSSLKYFVPNAVMHIPITNIPTWLHLKEKVKFKL